MLNENRICFIICYNDDLFLSECVLYINALNVPEGYDVDILTISGAESMTAGYQYAMQQSNAKYKIYLHQDVFIIHPDFLGDLLKIFQSDSAIGMIGMVGAVKMPKDAVMWNCQARCGALYYNEITKECENRFTHPISDAYREVEAVDGLLIATSQDIPWREDLFTGWDFYDVSQSAEFRLAGYKIVVPRQEQPWVIHDDDILDLKDYDYWRQKYLEEYS